MRKTFLVLGIACAALVAGAQSNARQDQFPKASGVTSSRDQATGQASGKRMHKPMLAVNDDQQASQQNVTSPRDSSTGMASGRRDAATGQAALASPRDIATGQASGKTAVRESPSKASDGKTMSSDDWNVQTKTKMGSAQSNPMYKGQTTSGTNPLYEDKARVATGDVNGDGASDAAVSSQPSGPAQMKGDFSRGHQPDTKAAGRGEPGQKTGQPAATTIQSPRDVASGQASGKRQH